MYLFINPPAVMFNRYSAVDWNLPAGQAGVATNLNEGIERRPPEYSALSYCVKLIVDNSLLLGLATTNYVLPSPLVNNSIVS